MSLVVKDDDKNGNKHDAGWSSFDSLGHCAPSLLSSDRASDPVSWKRKVMFWVSHYKYLES